MDLNNQKMTNPLPPRYGLSSFTLHRMYYVVNRTATQIEKIQAI